MIYRFRIMMIGCLVSFFALCMMYFLTQPIISSPTQSNGSVRGVQESKPVYFTVSRSGPTRIRINETSRIPMIISLTALQDVTGEIREYIPHNITVVWYGSAQIQKDESSQMISWKVSLKKGETYELKYEYALPPSSSQEYQLGPLFYNAQQIDSYWSVSSENI